MCIHLRKEIFSSLAHSSLMGYTVCITSQVLFSLQYTISFRSKDDGRPKRGISRALLAISFRDSYNWLIDKARLII